MRKNRGSRNETKQFPLLFAKLFFSEETEEMKSEKQRKLERSGRIPLLFAKLFFSEETAEMKSEKQESWKEAEGSRFFLPSFFFSEEKAGNVKKNLHFGRTIFTHACYNKIKEVWNSIRHKRIA